MKRVITALLFALLVITPTFADRPFDPASGRDTRQFPRDPQVHYQHIALDLVMRDPMSRSFTCDETIKFKTPGRSIDRLELDAVDLKIGKVTDLQGQPLDYRYDDKVLTVRFPSAIAPETESGVRKLSWFADKTFIGACDAHTVLCWKPTPGVYQLTALDDHGRSGSRSVTLR